MTIQHGFAEYLKPRLPLGCNLRVYHVSAQPASCPSLFAAAPGRVEEETSCESHFLVLAQAKRPRTGGEVHEQTIVLGLEVLVFTSPDLTTVFVSKADSTGFLVRQDGHSRSTSVAHTATAAFLDFLVQPRRSDTRVILSLFARSQNQYLFPGSIENVTKHVLDDRQLIKWWCRVLDTLMIKASDTKNTDSSTGPQAYVVVPGCDKSETKAFFPPSARSVSSSESRWRNDYPVGILVKDVSLPPRFLVPRLPDDPKSRFLDDLDESQIDEAGTWRGVKTLDQFWELMSYRQECSAGRLVGFVWLIFEKLHALQTGSTATAGAGEQLSNQDEAKEGPEHQPFDSINDAHSLGSATLFNEKEASPIRQCSIIANGNHETKTASEPTKEHIQSDKEPPKWPVSTRGQIVLKAEDYSTLMDQLLQLDFAGEDTAVESTKAWIEKATSLSKQDEFGREITGQLASTVRVITTEIPAVTNVITAVRKKRKAVVDNTNGTPVPVELSKATADSDTAKVTQRAGELISEVDSQNVPRKKVKS